ncbi:MAG: enoyl-CoA hydratase/isomerase family protein [Planctomycetes bacterium]|nr:enoyl-CoA hydratase/isomerase family protein [Planctomycetota bacterium]
MLKLSERGKVAYVQLNAPPVNILTTKLLEALRDAFAKVAASPARALLLHGAGKCFSAGADVGEHLPGQVEKMLPLFTKTIEELSALEIPTLAYVHGATLGGGFELAMACDLVVAAEDAKLGVPEITLGVFPPAAAAALPPEIGRRRALELLLTGDPITAKTAFEWGLVNRVGPEEEAIKFLERIVRHPRPALVACKKAARAGLAEAERIYLQELMSHPEPVEGLKAFIEKRAPSWKEK